MRDGWLAATKSDAGGGGGEEEDGLYYKIASERTCRRTMRQREGEMRRQRGPTG